MHALYDYRPPQRTVVRATGLEQMLNDLESHQLQVILVPLNPRLRNYTDGGCKQVVADKPPHWYRSFCGRHPSSRGVRKGKFDTRIRRQDVLRILRRLCAGLSSRSKYAEELVGISRRVA